MGAGRIVYQELTRITKAIEDGDFFENEELFRQQLKTAKENNSALTFIRSCYQTAVCTATIHIYMPCLELAKRNGIKNVYVHCFMDGRDTAPDGGKEFISQLSDKMEELGVGTDCFYYGTLLCNGQR